MNNEDNIQLQEIRNIQEIHQARHDWKRSWRVVYQGDHHRHVVYADAIRPMGSLFAFHQVALEVKKELDRDCTGWLIIPASQIEFVDDGWDEQAEGDKT